MLAVVLFFAFYADLFTPHGEKALVLLFIRTDCPISNRYAPELQRLYTTYASIGIDFRLIYPERGLSPAAIAQHRREYGYTIPALAVGTGGLITRAKVRTTPEAAVFVHGELIYHGRIDDRYIDFGKVRREAQRHDLEEVLADVIAGKTLRPRETKAIGCAIEELK